MPEFRLQGTVAAPPEAVWRVFTDHAGYTQWAGVKEVVLRQQGDPPPNGLGAIRVMRSGGIAIEEEITAFDPPKYLAYRMVGGIPVKNYEAEVRLDPSDSGTRLTWHVRFDARIPFTGRLMARLIKAGLQDVLDRLARVPFDQS
jgi:uncharacterized protein YndB with AHSA1/START domain